MDVHVVEVAWQTHRERLESVRATVFIDEQGVPADLERDGLDEDAIHFVAINTAGQVVGTARLLASGQIGRVAVLADLRGSGIGRRLLDLAVETARKQGSSRAFLHAQASATDFYLAAGFKIAGDEFMDGGIVHVEMELDLAAESATGSVDAAAGAIDAAAGAQSEPDAEPPAAGQSWMFDDARGCRSALGGLIEAGRRQLRLVSQELDHQLFDHADFVERVSVFARAYANANVRILIYDSSYLVSRGHLLIELARRLPSRIEIRKVPTEHADTQRSWMTVDDHGVWLLPDFREYIGAAATAERVEAKRLSLAFDRLWEVSEPDPELRTLGL